MAGVDALMTASVGAFVTASLTMLVDALMMASVGACVGDDVGGWSVRW